MNSCPKVGLDYTGGRKKTAQRKRRSIADIGLQIGLTPELAMGGHNRESHPQKEKPHLQMQAGPNDVAHQLRNATSSGVELVDVLQWKLQPSFVELVAS